MHALLSEPSTEGEVACRARIRTKSAAAAQDHEGLGAFVSEKSAAAPQNHEGLAAAPGILVRNEPIGKLHPTGMRYAG